MKKTAVGLWMVEPSMLLFFKYELLVNIGASLEALKYSSNRIMKNCSWVFWVNVFSSNNIKRKSD